ncbi:MAG: TraR/DksA C4-type zinc finger protein [Aeromonas sp.]
MSQLDDELERLAVISDQQIAARVHAARISGTGPHYCTDCDAPIPQARREAVRGCERCADCQSLFESQTIRLYGAPR